MKTQQEMKTLEVTCLCGTTWKVRSTVAAMQVEVCANCHPAYNGEKKEVRTGGQVEKFYRRWGRDETQKHQSRFPG